jgi:hypothetical protein
MSFSLPSFLFRGSGTAAAVDLGGEDAATAAGGESVVDAAAHGGTVNQLHCQSSMMADCKSCT